MHICLLCNNDILLWYGSSIKVFDVRMELKSGELDSRFSLLGCLEQKKIAPASALLAGTSDETAIFIDTLQSESERSPL